MPSRGKVGGYQELSIMKYFSLISQTYQATGHFIQTQGIEVKKLILFTTTRKLLD